MTPPNLEVPKFKTPSKCIKSNRAWRDRNVDHLKAYNKSRNDKVKNNPALRAKKLESGRKSYLKNAAKWGAYDRARDPIKRRARARLRDHIWRGKIKRLPCEVCGDIKSHGHHEDYTKPLDVIWLCRKHHIEIHAKAP